MEYVILILIGLLTAAGLYVSYILTEYQIAKRGYIYYIRYSPRWKRKAAECKRRAGYRCQVCNSPHKLEAHHRSYQRLFNEQQTDLTCLCHECHSLFSANGKVLKPIKSATPPWHKLLRF